MLTSQPARLSSTWSPGLAQRSPTAGWAPAPRLEDHDQVAGLDLLAAERTGPS